MFIDYYVAKAKQRASQMRRRYSQSYYESNGDADMGVSASHIDWTMVPYVRKSFFKHYRDGVEFIEGHELDYSFHNSFPIDEEDYKVYSPRAYEYAMKMTEKETYQAVEAMYHNLKILG